ncbi:hypothetical protein [Prauserella endophytica]|uniref:Glyoxalase-like domain-containing protein n=1 Tax=Prauserella endophytica TaxID=1592324 RepID=A0ABY2RYX0_9PSEU|nr:hypothetical protein [Prauserella endophytica]PXY33474.1 hypothetical protein BAY59_10325 [Prauserella coralliicola]TKG65814.1 hypothetical protein FCN18_26800 [Prauserella endophytica]
MTGHEASRGFAAMPAIVLNTAADPAQSKAWLCDVLGVGPGDVDCHLDPPHAYFAWPGGQAELRVDGGGAGASTAHLRVSGDGDLAARALAALAGQVDQNLDPG